MTNETLLLIASPVSALVGVFIKFLWDYFVGKIHEAEKIRETTFADRLDNISGELKSRLSSLELRFNFFEEKLEEFQKEVRVTFKGFNEAQQTTIEAVKSVIRKADEVNIETKVAVQENYIETMGKVKVIEDQVQTFTDWLKGQGGK